MTRLTWDKRKLFESGVDQGVLYLSSGIYPWNGLIDVTSTLDRPADAQYFEGQKVLDVLGNAEESLSIEAFTCPEAFLTQQGLNQMDVGLYSDDNHYVTFNLCYRVMENDNPILHLWFNLFAVPADFENTSLNEDPSLANLEWSVETVPSQLTGLLPASHLVVSKERVGSAFWADLERIVYGDANNNPQAMSIVDVANWAAGWNYITIVDNGDGTWSATGPDTAIQMLDDTSFQISSPDATYVNDDEYTISSTKEDPSGYNGS